MGKSINTLKCRHPADQLNLTLAKACWENAVHPKCKLCNLGTDRKKNLRQDRKWTHLYKRPRSLKTQLGLRMSKQLLGVKTKQSFPAVRKQEISVELNEPFLEAMINGLVTRIHEHCSTHLTGLQQHGSKNLKP